MYSLGVHTLACWRCCSKYCLIVLISIHCSVVFGALLGFSDFVPLLFPKVLSKKFENISLAKNIICGVVSDIPAPYLMLSWRQQEVGHWILFLIRFLLFQMSLSQATVVNFHRISSRLEIPSLIWQQEVQGYRKTSLVRSFPCESLSFERWLSTSEPSSDIRLQT